MSSILNLIFVNIGAILFGICVALSAFVYLRYKYWTNKKIPCAKQTPPFGFFAPVLLGKRSIMDECSRIYHEFSECQYVGTFILTKPVLMIRDNELIGNVLVRDFQHFQDRGLAYNEELDPLSANLFSLEGQKWKNLRTKLTPSFSPGKTKFMFKSMMQCTMQLKLLMENFIENEDGVFEVKEVAARFTTDVIALCAFGINCNCLKNPDAEFRYWGKKVLEPSVRSIVRDMLMFLAPELLTLLRFRGTEEGVSNFFMGIVNETINERESKSIRQNDFMQLLIDLRNQSEDKDAVLTTNQVAAEAFLFFIAGFETSSTVINFCLYELAINQDIQDKVRNEVNTVMNKNDGLINYEGVQEARYLEQVINETLRKYPPVGMMFRKCVSDYVIPGTNHILKNGDGVLIPVQALQHDPQYFPNPDVFDPERFSESSKTRIPNYVFMPFGDGPRICIGMRFGMMQVKLGIMVLLSSFKFVRCDRTEVPLQLNPRSFIPVGIHGTWLKVIKKDSDVLS